MTSTLVNSKRFRIIIKSSYWPRKVSEIVAEYAESSLMEKLLMLLARSRGACIDFIVRRKDDHTLLFQLKWDQLDDWHERENMPLEEVNTHHNKCTYILRFISQYKGILPTGQKWHKNIDCIREASFSTLLGLLTTSDWKTVDLNYHLSFTGISIYEQDRDAVFLHLHKLLTKY